MKDWALVVLRCGLGIIFAGHGLQKAFGWFGGPGIAGVEKFLTMLGFSPVSFWAYCMIFVELGGGICLILGIFPRISAALISVLMIVAVLKVHLAKGFFMQSGGFEYNFLIVSVCLALILMGGGKYSVFNKY
ncbi:MAG: DoxX family protein [Candidatus Omnitrophica bacterium]|nr:DoxX family protein [Candidatus Omnitrophota bacterium]